MNIILVSIDDLRYDCVGYQPFKKELERYGVAHILKTPTLDGIAEKSVCFTQAIREISAAGEPERSVRSQDKKKIMAG